MSIVEQLVDEVKELVLVRPKWTLSSEEEPDPTKLTNICAVWHDGQYMYLASVSDFIWMGGNTCYGISEQFGFKHFFKCWCEVTLPLTPP